MIVSVEIKAFSLCLVVKLIFAPFGFIISVVPVFFINLYQYISLLIISRLTVVSREAKKKQHTWASSGPRDHYSEYLHGWQL